MTSEQETIEALEKRVKELEERQRADDSRRLLFEQSLDLICVAGTDGYLQELNPSWTTVFGWTPDEFKSLPFHDLVHPEDLPSTQAATVQLIEGAKVVAFQNRCRTKDGTFRRLAWNAVFDHSRQKILAIARDVTELEATREALRASEAAFKQLFDGMLDGFSYHDMIFDEEGNAVDYRFRAVNPAFEDMTGLAAKDIVGRSVREIFPHPEKQWIQIFGTVAKTGKPLRFENYAQAFGKWFEILAFRPGPGQSACTLHDITARRRAEAERANLQAQVEHAQKLESLGVMAGGVAHDFNNVLTAIMSGIELATAQLPTESDTARSDLATALAAAERARDLCRQMLAYAGRTEVRKRPTDLGVLAREIIALATPSFSKKVSLVWEESTHPLRVVADSAQVSQVLLNLLLNAGEAIGDQAGKITVSTGVRPFGAGELSTFEEGRDLAPGSYAFLGITDTGCGMTDETRARIFDPFFSTKFTGRGLGLATALGILRAHKGGIHVKSDPGRGSSFLVIVPEANGADERQVATPASARRFPGGGTVLIVDDEAAVRRVTARLINLLGFDVLEASDGVQALEFFRNRPQAFRAIMLDVKMPRMGGREVLPVVRRMRPELPVLLMSGYDEQPFVASSHDRWVAFLQKPFRREELENTLRALLAGDGASASPAS